MRNRQEIKVDGLRLFQCGRIWCVATATGRIWIVAKMLGRELGFTGRGNGLAIDLINSMKGAEVPMNVGRWVLQIESKVRCALARVADSATIGHSLVELSAVDWLFRETDGDRLESWLEIRREVIGCAKAIGAECVYNGMPTAPKYAVDGDRVWFTVHHTALGRHDKVLCASVGGRLFLRASYAGKLWKNSALPAMLKSAARFSDWDYDSEYLRVRGREMPESIRSIGGAALVSADLLSWYITQDSAKKDHAKKRVQDFIAKAESARLRVVESTGAAETECDATEQPAPQPEAEVETPPAYTVHGDSVWFWVNSQSVPGGRCLFVAVGAKLYAHITPVSEIWRGNRKGRITGHMKAYARRNGIDYNAESICMKGSNIPNEYRSQRVTNLSFATTGIIAKYLGSMAAEGKGHRFDSIDTIVGLFKLAVRVRSRIAEHMRTQPVTSAPKREAPAQPDPVEPCVDDAPQVVEPNTDDDTADTLNIPYAKMAELCARAAQVAKDLDDALVLVARLRGERDSLDAQIKALLK